MPSAIIKGPKGSINFKPIRSIKRHRQKSGQLNCRSGRGPKSIPRIGRVQSCHSIRRSDLSNEHQSNHRLLLSFGEHGHVSAFNGGSQPANDHR